MIWINVLSKNPINLKKYKPNYRDYEIMEKYFFNYEERIDGKKADFEMNIKIDWDITKEEAIEKITNFLNKKEIINIDGEMLQPTIAEMMAIKFSSIK
ncbi:hypothetical protein [[Mycoplasma] collis]|uniref:hypothetical protein n=1 Tax=[Mycoplasma] collis TaxID=2127 RepID=UPI000A422DAB|nr:hypothetical protein [[Mycoplasma] collis]